MSNLERAIDGTGKRLDNLERTLSQCIDLLLKLQVGEDKTRNVVYQEKDPGGRKANR